jgi:hypothetical protein
MEPRAVRGEPPVVELPVVADNGSGGAGVVELGRHGPADRLDQRVAEAAGVAQPASWPTPSAIRFLSRSSSTIVDIDDYRT